MGETTTEYLHIVVNTIIFCSAIGLLLAFLTVLSRYNKNEMELVNEKSSITMDVTLGYSWDFIYVSGSEVFTDIMNQDSTIAIFLDGTQISSDYIRNLKENNRDYINDLKTKIAFNDEYLVKHTYYSTNQIKSVEYEHR